MIAVQEGRTVRGVPEACDGNVPAAQAGADRCENTVRGTLTLMDARCCSDCWEVETPGGAGAREKNERNSGLKLNLPEYVLLFRQSPFLDIWTIIFQNGQTGYKMALKCKKATAC